MIYALCITQVLTIVGAVLIVNWMLTRLKQAEEEGNRLVREALGVAKAANESSQELVRTIVEHSDAQVQAVIDKAYRDREILLERIQHPEYMKAQAPAADKGAKSKPHTMDEEREFELEHPDAPKEAPSAEGIIPGARPEDEEIKPVEPVRPFGKGRSDNGSTE